MCIGCTVNSAAATKLDSSGRNIEHILKAGNGRGRVKKKILYRSLKVHARLGRIIVIKSLDIQMTF